MNKLIKAIIGKDYILLTFIAVLTAMSFYSTCWLAISTPVKLVIWLGWLVCFGVLSFFTKNGRVLYSFCREAQIELLKVVWPNRQETVQTTTIVMIMVAVMGFILWAIDSLMMMMIAKITHLG